MVVTHGLSTVVAQEYMRKVLTRDGTGMGRYVGDLFFFKSKFNPCGREVGADTPPWGSSCSFLFFFLSWVCFSVVCSLSLSLLFVLPLPLSPCLPPSHIPPAPAGVTTMFQAMAELTLSQRDVVTQRLRWMVDRAAGAGMPVGECVDGTTGKFAQASAPDVYEHGLAFFSSCSLAFFLLVLCMHERPPQPRHSSGQVGSLCGSSS